MVQISMLLFPSSLFINIAQIEANSVEEKKITITALPAIFGMFFFLSSLIRLTFDFNGSVRTKWRSREIVNKHWKNWINENKTQLLIIDSVFEGLRAMQSKQASMYMCVLIFGFEPFFRAIPCALSLSLCLAFFILYPKLSTSMNNVFILLSRIKRFVFACVRASVCFCCCFKIATGCMER